jgi:hypothetical protein
MGGVAKGFVLGAAGTAGIALLCSWQIQPPPSWVFHIPGQAPLVATKVGDFAAAAPVGAAWPYAADRITVICAPSTFAAIVGPTDVLALNGRTSSFGGFVRQDAGGHVTDLPIVGLSDFEEARHSSAVSPKATADDLYPASASFLRSALATASCR